MKRKNEAKERLNKIFIVAVIAVFVLSTLAIVMSYQSGNSNTTANAQTITLGGADYSLEQKTDDFGQPYYLMSSKTDSFYVYYMPQQINNIMDNNTQEYMKKMNYFYLAFNPNDTNIQFLDYLRYDLRKNLPASVYFADSITAKSDKYQLPEVSCMNASLSSPVVILTTQNTTTNITKNGNCIMMNMVQYDSFRVRDAFVYLLRGISLR